MESMEAEPGVRGLAPLRNLPQPPSAGPEKVEGAQDINVCFGVGSARGRGRERERERERERQRERETEKAKEQKQNRAGV